MRPSINEGLKDLGLRIAGAAGAVGLVVLLALFGDIFNIRFLDSGGGLLIGVILVMEGLFFSAVIYASVTGRI